MSELFIGVIISIFVTLLIVVPIFVGAEMQREKIFKSRIQKLKDHNHSLFQQVGKLKDEKTVLERDLNLARQAAETFTVGTIMPAKTVKLGYTQGLYSDYPAEIELVQENIKAGLADSISPFIRWTRHGGSVRGTLLVVDNHDS